MNIASCANLQYPYGPSLRLIFGALDVTFSATVSNFRAEQGSERISWHGYERTFQDATTAKAEAHLLGASLIKGVPYGPKYQMDARLHLLTDQQVETAIGIFHLSHKVGALVTLHDQRIVTKEPTPRTRAKVGTVIGAPTVAGMEYYYAQYRVWVTQWSEPYRLKADNNYLDFSVIEIGAPIAPGNPNDLP
jgi:hypothetical protein